MKRFAVSSWLFVACALAANAAMAAMGVVQLWEGGPYWAESNLGESEDAGHPEYGGFYSVDNAAAEVAKLGEGWRLPNKGELEALMNDDYCDRTWTTRNGVEGYLFSDKTDPSKSVFLPAAGCDDGGGRSSAGEKGLYWSSTRFDVYGTYHLDFGFERHDFPLERSHGVSVRAVRDAPLVTIDEVGSVEPWDRAKGAVTVDYSLAWLDATIKYKVVFDISANGKTASITNDAVNLPEGSRTQTIETVKAFGNETLSRDAKVKVSLIAVKPKSPDGQLWAGGPVWAACNVGATTPGDLGISTNWYDTVWAVADIMGSSWRVPTFEDLLALRDRCTVNWATCKNINGEDVKGFRLQGKGGCSSNSIFLPCAFYWSSTGLGDEQAISMTVIDHLQIDSFNPRSFLGTIRALRDATPEWQEVFEATAEERLSLGVAEVVLPTGMTGYGYAVSNLTVGVEIPPAEPDGSNYALPLGAKVGIYAVAEARYVISAVDPLVIDTVTGHTKVEVDDLPVPTVYAPGSKENPWIVTVGNFPRGTTAWTSGDGAVTNAVREGVFTVPDGTANVKVFFTAKPGYELVGETVVDLGTVTVDVTFGSGSGYKLPSVRTLPVEYVDADGVVREKAFGEFTKVTASTKKLADGKWYAVIDDVTLTNSLPVEGSAHLILCDWATLAITNSTAEAAISVGDGASLAIYGQTADTGRLAVSGGNAGIGGKTSGVCGAIAIHGGTISASAMSNKYAAGIGSGALGSGGSVTITGGRITAQGGTGAEDIGSGRNATSPCEVFISGGVFAREPDDDWLAPGFAAVTNTDVATAAEYPYAVLPTYPVSWNENTDKMSVLVQMGGETVTDNPVTVLAGDAVEFIVLPKGEYEYAAVPEGWSLRPDGGICNRFEVVDGSIEVTIPEPTLKPYTITYTTGNGTLVTNGVTRYTIETETFSLPSDSDIDMNGVVDVTLRGWKNAAGKVVTEVVKGTSGDLEFFARWASTVSTCQISWNENPGKVSVRAQVDGFDITDNPATVAAGDVVEFIVMPKPGYGYEVAPEGWSLRTDGGICNRFEVVDDSIEVKIPDPTGEPITYTITYFDYGEWIDGFEPVTEYTFETETFNLPVAGDIAPRMGGMFQRWTNEVGETVSEVVRGTEGNLNFYAVWKSAGADPIQAIIGDKVEGFENLPSVKQKAVYDNVQHFYNQFLDVDRTEAWIATVYGEGAKVPAAKFAATTEDLVNVSFKYGLPIMAPPVTIHVTTAAEGLGFTFAITDGDKDAVSVKAANLYGLMKYTASLDDEFHVATDKEVTFDANPDVTFTARFVEGPSAGFMKAELIVPDPAED